MKIQIKANNYLKELDFNQILCINANSDNQEMFKEIFLNGVRKKDKGFLIDGTTDFDDYEVLEYSGNSILDDLKLTKKSINYQLLDGLGNNIDLDYYDELNGKLEIFQDNINSKYDLLIENYPDIIKPQIRVNSFNELIKKCYQMIDTEEINEYLGLELQIMMLINFVRQNKNKKFFLILNNLDRYLDLSQMLYIVDQITLQDNLYAVILQKNFDFCDYSKNVISNYLLSDSEFRLFNELKIDDENNTKFDYLNKQEKDVILQYLSKENLKKIYYKMVSEKKIN